MAHVDVDRDDTATCNACASAIDVRRVRLALSGLRFFLCGSCFDELLDAEARVRAR